MIQSKSELNYYIQQDRIMNGQGHLTNLSKIKQLFVPNLCVRYLYFLRKTEYWHNNLKSNVLKKLLGGVLYVYYQYRKRNLGIRLGYSIPLNVVGPGLSLPHIGTIVINDNARIGKNCRLHVGVNIGASGGNPKAPQIGDNVYIGPGAILFGDIRIADNVTVGANATVNKSFEKEKVVVAGSPATIVKENYPSWIELNKNIIG